MARSALTPTLARKREREIISQGLPSPRIAPTVSRERERVTYFSRVPNRRSISGKVTLKFTAAIRPRM